MAAPTPEVCLQPVVAGPMHRILLALLLQGRVVLYLWAIVSAATSAGSCRLCWSASASAMPSEQLHSCRCAARRLARRFSQPQTRPSERTNHSPTCFVSSCGYVSVSLNRTRLVRTTRVGQSQRARVQHADASQHPTGHGALRPCWYSRRCKGFMRSSLECCTVLYRALRRVSIGYSVE